MARPVVALLTDFGLSDHYVAAMKAVVLGVCPDAALVDITHLVPPQDVVAAGLELAACYRDFPPATVFLVVVDPGVGSGRRALAADAAGYFFVGPDNGVLAPIFAQSPPARLVELTAREFARADVSRTFEGRDRFAPAAGWIARGTPLDRLGAAVTGWVDVAVPRAALTAAGIAGEVVRVDRFGNLITNISDGMLGQLVAPVVIDVSGHALAVVPTYSAAAAGALCALVGSSGHLEVAVNGGSAAERLGAGRGLRVAVRGLAAGDAATRVAGETPR